jgi:hypothetical protein
MKLLKTLTACMSHESQGKSTPKNSTKSPQINYMSYFKCIPPMGSNLLTGFNIAILRTLTLFKDRSSNSSKVYL